MQKSPLREKSYKLAVQTVNLCRNLKRDKEFVLSDQLLRSGTGIGANIEEAIQAQSRRDFVSKLSIALKEANETRYWLRLLNETTPKSGANLLLPLIHEIISMLISTIKTTRAT
jgi:four helix bundle protein